MKGELAWPACARHQVIGRHRQSRDHRMSVQMGTQRHLARTCLAIPRHRVVDRSRMAFSKKILLDTTPELAANSALSLRRAKAPGPARPNFSWLSGMNRHAPVPCICVVQMCHTAPGSAVLSTPCCMNSMQGPLICEIAAHLSHMSPAGSWLERSGDDPVGCGC